MASKYVNTTKTDVFKAGGEKTVIATSGFYAQTASSTPVVNTTSELTLIGTGVGALSVPANAFSIGDSFSVVMGGHISSANNDDLHIRIYGDGALLADTGLINMPQITNRNWELEITFTVRSLGGPGVASIISHGSFIYEKDASNAFEGTTFSIVNNTTFNTTILNTLNITAQWDAAKINNSIYSDVFVLSKIY